MKKNKTRSDNIRYFHGKVYAKGKWKFTQKEERESKKIFLFDVCEEQEVSRRVMDAICAWWWILFLIYSKSCDVDEVKHMKKNNKQQHKIPSYT